MPSDIFFNPQTREIEFAPNGDFETTENPSVQNGAVLLEARCFNIIQPAFGIGFNSQIIGSATSQAAFQLNRWVSQISADGGRGSIKMKNNPPGTDFDFEADVNYLQQ